MQNQNVPALDLKRFGISAKRGFLPAKDPVRWWVNPQFSWGYYWEQLAEKMPKLLAAKKLRMEIQKLAGWPKVNLLAAEDEERDRAIMRTFSFLAHGYVWENWMEKPEGQIPSHLAVPWQLIAKRLGRPPVLSYPSYALDNWYRLDSSGPIELGNLALIQNFLGGLDEEWFVLIHVEIEAKAGPALAAIGKAQQAVSEKNDLELANQLKIISNSLSEMHKTLCRMPENCDPRTYYLRVRPYIAGFARNPVIYEGVEEYGNRPQNFLGETGAQGSIIPSLDAAFSIEHADDALKHFVVKMMDYMPPKHRAFIEAVRSGPSIRKYIESRPDDKELSGLFTGCVSLLRDFRTKHLEYAKNYIAKQEQASVHNPVDYGTGGTPLIPYLSKHCEETK